MVKKLDESTLIGNVYESKSYGKYKIVSYKNYNEVVIEFLNTGYRKVSDMKSVRNGKVKDVKIPTVYGVGIIGDKYPTRVEGKQIRPYIIWKDMLRRCYDEKHQEKHPTYKGCSVSDNFKYFEYFYEWFNNQVGFDNKQWVLDKDILFKGNKIYSEDTCVLVPTEINSLLTKRQNFRGNYYIGVTFDKTINKFTSKVSLNNGKRRHIGSFNTEIEAFNAYKQAKECYVKELANKWRGRIDEKAYKALMSYEVSIND